MTKLYIQNGSVVSQRFSVSRDPQVRAVAPIIPAVDQMAGQGLLQTWPRPPVPEMAEIIGIAGEYLHDALSGRITTREALSRAQNRADGLMQSRGYF
jgi:multiple sugar transport system substrate-binding protein